MSDSKRQIEVRMHVTILRTVTCEGCTEEQAIEDPFGYAVRERDGDVVDFEVLSVSDSEN